MKTPEDNPQGITHRIINGIYCKCLDTGCPDFQRAKENRELVTKHFTPEIDRWWNWMERSRDATRHRNRLPPTIPVGKLSIISEVDLKAYILWELSKEET